MFFCFADKTNSHTAAPVVHAAARFVAAPPAPRVSSPACLGFALYSARSLSARMQSSKEYLEQYGVEVRGHHGAPRRLVSSKQDPRFLLLASIPCVLRIFSPCLMRTVCSQLLVSQAAVARAVTQILKERPSNPVAAIGKILSGAATDISNGVIGVGSNFPMDVVVHQGFAGKFPDAPKPMSTFLKGAKALVVSLPGAFTPTWCAAHSRRSVSERQKLIMSRSSPSEVSLRS